MAKMSEMMLTKDDLFSVAAALYWYCSDYHSGQNSEEYAILSQLDYRPGACQRGIDAEDSTSAAMYEDLSRGLLSVEDVYNWVKENM